MGFWGESTGRRVPLAGEQSGTRPSIFARATRSARKTGHKPVAPTLAGTGWHHLLCRGAACTLQPIQGTDRLKLLKLLLSPPTVLVSDAAPAQKSSRGHWPPLFGILSSKETDICGDSPACC